MDAPIASYALEIDGWRWIYELFDDRLIMEGVKGEEKQHFEAELRHLDEIPDRSVTNAVARRPGYSWITIVAYLSAPAVFAIGGLAYYGFDWRLPDPLTGKEWILIFVGALMLMSLTSQVLSFFQKQSIQRHATFKRKSDGSVAIALSSAIPPNDSFEDFPAEVSAAIRRRQGADPAHVHSIKRDELRIPAIASCIASYWVHFQGWNWMYELYADRLIFDGVNGVDRQHFEIELRHCSEVLDRGAHIQQVPHPASSLIVGGLYLSFILAWGFVVNVLKIQFPAPLQGNEWVALIACIIVVQTLGYHASRLLQKRVTQHYATLKRISDGGSLGTLTSSLGPKDDAFENFVSEAIAAIRFHRGNDPEHAHSITT